MKVHRLLSALNVKPGGALCDPSRNFRISCHMPSNKLSLPPALRKKRKFPFFPAIAAVATLGLFGAAPSDGNTIRHWEPFEFLLGSQYKDL